MYYLISIVFLSLLISGEVHNKTVNVCETEECKNTATLIVTSIDHSIKPCDDFYKYSCGNWIEDHPAPDNDSAINRFTNLSDDVEHYVTDILNKSSTEKDPKYFHPMINFFKGCMNSEERNANEKRDLSIMKGLFKRMGGFPLIDDNWNETEFDVENAFIEFIKINPDRFLFDFNVIHDLRNKSLRYVKMTDPTWFTYGSWDIISLPKRKTRKSIKKDIYYSTSDGKTALKTILETLKNSPIDESLIEKDMNELDKLQDIYDNSSYSMDDINQMNENLDKFKTQVRSLSTIKGLDFRKILNGVLKTENIVLNDSDIIVAEIDFLQKVADALGETSKRAIANKLSIELLRTLLPYTSENMINLSSQYFIQVITPPENFCRYELSQSLHDLLSRYYYEKRFGNQLFEDMNEIVVSLEEAFHQILAENQWMDEKTKKEAINKLNHISKQISFPDYILNATLLQEKYKKFHNLSENNFFQNILNFNLDKFSTNLQKLANSDIKKGDWSFVIQPETVNAMYDMMNNTIYIPAAIQQMPFYHNTLPRSVNFGSIGHIIAHEISHAFDNQGCLYDERGNYRNWFTDKSKELFNTKSQCFVKQYNNISYDFGNKVVININGTQTLGENIADNGAIRIAFRAMEIYKKKNSGNTPKLPSILSTYSDEELFFASFGNLWCTTEGTESFKEGLKSEPHSPEDARVRVTLSNFPEFAKTYNCPIGSAMNPKEKCVLWG